ncbi:MAG: ASCH domain-containing protein [Pseudomonadota bacterium]
MPRNMSFMMTTAQMYDRIKTVTRRDGWWFLKPGDRLWAVEKAMGLKKGEKVKRICMIEVVSTRGEPLWQMPPEDCALEGFPEMHPVDFAIMLVEKYGCSTDKVFNRIEFKYLDGGI